jgi:hypothetical protein
VKGRISLRTDQWPLFDVLGTWEKLGVFFFPLQFCDIKLAILVEFTLEEHTFPIILSRKWQNFSRAKKIIKKRTLAITKKAETEGQNSSCI